MHLPLIGDAGYLHDIQEEIRKITGSQFHLSGGCVVDYLYHSPLVTKDFDIFLPNITGYGEEEAYSIMERHETFLRKAGFSTFITKAYGDGTHDFNKRLFGLVRATKGAHKYDLLYSRAKSIIEVATNHDCNMNRVYVDSDGYIRGSKVKHLEFREDGTISSIRRERMTIKAQMLGIEPF